MSQQNNSSKNQNTNPNQYTQIKIKRNYETHSSHSINSFEPSKAKQAFADECDINNIMKKYQETGLLPDMIKTNPRYGDFSDSSTYQDSLNLVQHAQEQFAALPSATREKFNNDPVQFLAFTENPKNIEEMIKMGIAKEIDAPTAPPALTQEALTKASKKTSPPKDD